MQRLAFKSETRLAILLILTLEGHGRLKVQVTRQVQCGEEGEPSAQRSLHPVPADLQVAQAPKPIWVDEAAVALANHCGALRNQIERCEGQHKAQPCQSLGGTNQGGFQLKSVGFIVQKVLLDIEPYPILFEGRPIRRFIAEHIPDVVTLLRASHSQMQWTIALVGDEHPRPETGVPPRHRKALDLAARTPMTIEPEATLDPDTKVPAKPVQMAHQLRIGKAPIGPKRRLCSAQGAATPPCRAGLCRRHS